MGPTLDRFARLSAAVARAVPCDRVTGYSVRTDAAGALVLTLERGPCRGTASASPFAESAHDAPDWIALDLVRAALDRLDRTAAATA